MLDCNDNVVQEAVPVPAAAVAEGVVQEPAPTIESELEVLSAALARANRNLETKKKTMSKIRAELTGKREQIEELNNEMEELKERLERAENQTTQYRNWWLNEVQFTKLILNKVPNANQDWDLVRTSQSHYLGRF